MLANPQLALRAVFRIAVSAQSAEFSRGFPGTLTAKYRIGGRDVWATDVHDCVLLPALAYLRVLAPDEICWIFQWFRAAGIVERSHLEDTPQKYTAASSSLVEARLGAGARSGSNRICWPRDLTAPDRLRFSLFNRGKPYLNRRWMAFSNG